jgi:MerR family regulatory protein
MSSYRISQLAQQCGVPASTLRFYEGAGLLPAERTAVALVLSVRAPDAGADLLAELFGATV